MRKIRQIDYEKYRRKGETDQEREHRALSAKAAAEGMVLLENNGMLPLRERGKIALFGAGARHTVTGGTGSGDVHERYSVNIEEGLKAAGFTITTEKWLDDYDAAEEKGKREHYTDIYTRAGKLCKGQPNLNMEAALVQTYLHTPGYVPAPGMVPTEEDLEESDGKIAVFVLVRNAGEGKDRRNLPGDYQLAEEEMESIRFLREHFEKLLVIVNCGGVMDLSFLDTCGVDALLYIHQPGMEAGTAVARILTGEVTPSGKLTDTWPMHYEDYPNSDTFSHMGGDETKEYYTEGIYVGYRYFDKAGIVQRYAFGYGMSYTKFSWRVSEITVEGDRVTVSADVENVGTKYSGREVLQLYVVLPTGRLPKEEKRLVAFAKTKELTPGESQKLTMHFAISDCTSFDESRSTYILEPGSYGVMLGNASDTVKVCAYLQADRELQVQRTAHVCPLKEDLQELVLPEKYDESEQPDPALPVFAIDGEAVRKADTADVDCHEIYSDFPMEETEEEKRILDQMTGEQMAVLVCGTPTSGTFQSDIGTAAATVPGAAGETTSNYIGEPWHLANMILADGPAGIRILKRYQRDPKGDLYPMNMIEKFFGPAPRKEGTDYYQYCTRIPSGTLLAQTFDPELMEQMGHLVGEEMEKFHITLWLAPGMNIHRNPLCGRNFEYYSEDPYLTGKMAAAITRGVQSCRGVGTTIKHFVCNNQEDNRQHRDSIVSERALREIYLKGFEIAVKESNPLAVMSSYNLLNGVHTANSYDLLTNVLRKEWGFQGMVMTDWNTTGKGGSVADFCIRAGNDLVMPGTSGDVNEIIWALRDASKNSLQYRELRTCAARIVRTILQSNRYEQGIKGENNDKKQRMD